MKKINLDKNIFNDYYWLNEPEKYYFENAMVIETEPQKDFCQRTHYSYENQ